MDTVLGGSYPYLAPEAFRHRAITEAVDVYSFGIMLLEMVTLDAPWAGMQPYHITVAVAVDQKRPKIPPLGPRAFPREARKLVTDCWRQDPEGRPAAIAQTPTRPRPCAMPPRAAISTSSACS